jgi:hypothetical protein
MRIAQLKSIRAIWQEEANQWFVSGSPKSAKQRSILARRLDAVDAELERKTGRTRDVLRRERCAVRAAKESRARRVEAKATRTPQVQDGPRIRITKLPDGSTITQRLE